MTRIINHPILGREASSDTVTIVVDGKEVTAKKGEVIAAALIAAGIIINRYTIKKKEPRGLFCGIGQCTDCIMTVNGVNNVRVCITPVEEGMVIETQHGLGEFKHA